VSFAIFLSFKNFIGIKVRLQLPFKYWEFSMNFVDKFWCRRKNLCIVFALYVCIFLIVLKNNITQAKDLPPELQFTCELALKHAPETDPKKERTKKCEQWSAKHKEDSAMAARSAAASKIETPIELCMQDIKKGDAAGAQNRFENCLSQAIKKQADKKGTAQPTEAATVPAIPLPTKPPGTGG
jgi:hypothetical protein